MIKSDMAIIGLTIPITTLSLPVLCNCLSCHYILRVKRSWHLSKLGPSSSREEELVSSYPTMHMVKCNESERLHIVLWCRSDLIRESMRNQLSFDSSLVTYKITANFPLHNHLACNSLHHHCLITPAAIAY